MITSPHLVLAGGGALGNLYPGLAAARALSELCPHVELTFVGAGDPNERHAALTVCHNYLSVPAQPAPRSPLEGLRYLTDNAAGYWASRWLLGERNATLLLSLGGPVSTVMTRAAHDRGTPFVLLEPNARVSRTARTLGPHAEAVCLAHPEAQATMPVQSLSIVTGVPVRDVFTRPAAPIVGEDPDPRKQLLILGGACGARSRPLNHAAVHALARVRDNLGGWRILHQAGQGQLQATEAAYQAAGLDALVVSHLDDIDTAMLASDLVICRSGASTLAELATTGTPAILAPLPATPDEQQRVNAAACVAAGGALAVDERSAEPLEAAIARQLGQLLPNEFRRAQMASCMRAIARPDAALRVAEICAGLLGVGSARAAA